MTIICVPYKVSKILRALKCHHLQTTNISPRTFIEQEYSLKKAYFVCQLPETK